MMLMPRIPKKPTTRRTAIYIAAEVRGYGVEAMMTVMTGARRGRGNDMPVTGPAPGSWTTMRKRKTLAVANQPGE